MRMKDYYHQGNVLLLIFKVERKKRCGKNKRWSDEIRHDRGKDGVISGVGRGQGAAPRGLCVFRVARRGAAPGLADATCPLIESG